MQSSHSLHKIYNEAEFTFSAAEYSRFKFGDDLIAEKFGIALADSFIDAYLAKNKPAKQIVVIPSPYAFIPTATFAMKNYFVFQLNRWLAENDLPVVQETKITRSITYKQDYGELSAAERINLIGNDSFEIDKAFVENKTLIFLDDIKITGSHERMIKRMIAEYGIGDDFHLLYFAELVNHDINPRIENYLNYHFVKSVFDLDDIIKNERFAINTRIVKYILNTDPNVFKIFIGSYSVDFINLLYNMALGNSYHKIESYLPNLNYLKQTLKLNNLKQLQYGN